MSYKHFSLEERYYIEIELRKGTSINSIARAYESSYCPAMQDLFYQALPFSAEIQTKSNA